MAFISAVSFKGAIPVESVCLASVILRFPTGGREKKPKWFLDLDLVALKSIQSDKTHAVGKINGSDDSNFNGAKKMRSSGVTSRRYKRIRSTKEMSCEKKGYGRRPSYLNLCRLKTHSCLEICFGSI